MLKCTNKQLQVVPRIFSCFKRSCCTIIDKYFLITAEVGVIDFLKTEIINIRDYGELKAALKYFHMSFYGMALED